MLKLRNYQEENINELHQKIEKFLDLESNNLCVLQSPTGSGKTIMMAELIKRMADNRQDGKELSFIWITVHKLHDQSKEKLERYYEDLQTIECSNFNDLQDIQIQDKEILFFNWQSINQENNIYIRENEYRRNLSEVIENTKEANREIVLIIDESHHTASSEKSKKIINMINPKITIEVSATPKNSDADYTQKIDFQKVKESGMIKNSVRLNYELDSKRVGTADELIIKMALEKRQELKTHYENEKSNVNPLVLIQLPNSGRGISDKKDQVIGILNSKFRINVENGKLGIYLSDKGDKENIENIEKNDNEVQVLIIKQAITIGWDCPRASILVLFREWKKFTFSIQTMGRIIRMPQTKHYQNDELNHAYVYTNVEDIEIIEVVAKDYITTSKAEIKLELYDAIDLKSIYFIRKHERNRLTMPFYDFFEEVTNELKLIDKISLNVPKTMSNLPVGEIKQIDKRQKIDVKTVPILTGRMDLHSRFISFSWECSEGFASVYSSAKIRQAIYDFFEKNKIIDWDEIIPIVLNPKNKPHFICAINLAKDKFKKRISDEVKKEKETIPKWNVPNKTEYTKMYEEKPYKKYIMKPAFVQTNVKNEVMFMDFLDDENNNVKWWFKNEVNEKKYFAISYVDPDDEQEHAFYVDFVIYMNDGKIGLIDTKNDITAQIAKPKAEALSKYIKDIKSKKVFGGIAIFEQNEWRYNDNEEYRYRKNDLSGWKHLDLN